MPLFRSGLLASLLFSLLSVTPAAAQDSRSWMLDRPAGQDSTEPSKAEQPEARPPAKVIAPQQPAVSPAEAEEPKPTVDEVDEDQTTDASTTDATLELARKAQNPISSMVSVPFQYNANFGVGPENATSQVMNIQPVYPVSAGDLTLVNRAIIPISYLPNEALPVSARSGAELGLGDINYQLFFVPDSGSSSLTWGVGPTFTLPTATSDRLGTGKWLGGVSAVALTMKGPWVGGALVSQQWSMAGDSDRPDVSIGTIQPFVNYNMKKGWYLTTSPIISANWKAPSDERWTVPIGGGVGRIFAMGEQKVNLSLAGFGNVVKPTGGPDWSVRLQFTLLFPGL